MSKATLRLSLIAVVLLAFASAARAAGPPMMAGSAPVPIDPGPGVALPFVPPTHVVPRLPILLTTVHLGGAASLQQPFLLEPADVRENRRVTSSLRVYSTGLVEIDERSDTFVCFFTFDRPRLTLYGDVPLTPEPCSQTEDETLRVFVPIQRVQDLQRRLSRLRAIRLPSQKIESPFVLVYPPRDQREVTVFRPRGRGDKDGMERGARSIANTFGYREPIDRYMLIEAEIQRFLAIVREEGSSSGGIVISGPIIDPPVVTFDR